MKTIVVLGATSHEIKKFQEYFSLNSDGVGYIHNLKILVDLTGVGVINAACKTQEIIDKHKPSAIIATALCGALEKSLSIGDVAIVKAAIYSDFDVRSWNPEYKRGEIPFSKERVFFSDLELFKNAKKISDELSENYFSGYIASGSKFLNSDSKKSFNESISELQYNFDEEIHIPNIPNIYDMETVAIYQVAKKNQTPVLAIQTVSDTLDGNAAKDYDEFLKYASESYIKILEKILSMY